MLTSISKQEKLGSWGIRRENWSRS